MTANLDFVSDHDLMGILNGFDLLECPVCATRFSQEEKRLVCTKNHSFDLARQGYVNLTGQASPLNADTSEMLQARERFLAGKHYLPIAEELAKLTGSAETIVEVGAGTGYYLGACLDGAKSAIGLATDISTRAARRLAKCHPRAKAVVANTWTKLPIVSSLVDLLLCVFAPRNVDEFARITSPVGSVVVVTPTSQHLAQLRHEYGLLGIEQNKTDHLSKSFSTRFNLIDKTRISRKLVLSPEAATDLIVMGPNSFHHKPKVHHQIETTLDVEVFVWKRRLAGL